jgi:hypothetical protein
MTDMLISLGLIAANGHASLPQNRLHTFMGPHRRRTRLDYIIIQKERRSLIQRVRCITPHTVHSDHRLLALDILIPPPYRPTFKPPHFHNWGFLRWPDKVKAFDDCLMQQPYPETYSDFTRAIKAVADEIIPPVARGPPSILELYCNTLSPESDAVDILRQIVAEEKRHRNSLRKQMATLYQVARDQLLQTAINQLTQLSEAGKQRKVWQVVNSLSKRHQRPKALVAAASITERLQLFRGHFYKVLNQPPAAPQQLQCPPDLPAISAEGFNCSLISRREVKAVVKRFPKFKAFGPDGVSAAVFKSGAALTYIRTTMNRLLQNGDVPPEWLQSQIVAIPKKPSAATLDNYRGISLMSVSAKLFNKVILQRLATVLDPLLLPWQSGFRSGRCTTEQITALRLIVDRCKARKKDVVIVFVDFSKAFDSVDRAALGQILRLYGVPEELLGPVMALYTATTATVRTTDGDTEYFPTTSGILQGDTLAPFLFVVLMDYVLRTALIPLMDHAFTISPTAGALPALAFADDVALLATTFEGAEKMVTNLVAVSSPVGLRLAFEKTIVLAHSSLPAPEPPLPAFPDIKICSNFKYLGSLMADTREAFQERRRLAWGAVRSLHPIFYSSAAEILKARLFRAVVEPVLLYGCESWVVPRSLQDSIDASHRALLRAALNIHWPVVVRNSDLYARAECLPASTTMRQKRLSQFGKAAREDHRNLPLSRVLNHPPSEQYRRRGRPPMDMWSVIKEDLDQLGLTFAEAWEIASDAKEWARRLTEL